MKTIPCSLLMICTLIFGCANVTLSYAANQPKPQPEHNVGKPSTLRVDSGTLYTGEGVPIGLRGITATIQKTSRKPSGQDGEQKGDDAPNTSSQSQVITIDSGHVLLTNDALTKMMNKKIGEDGKIHDLKLTTDKNQVKITGKAKKAIDVPFMLEGPARPTPDGQIEIDAKTVRAADIPGLAQLLGMNVQKAVGNKPSKGVHAQQNTIIFNPDQLWGLPIHGRVTGVSVQKNGVVLAFGSQNQNQNHKQPRSNHGSPKTKMAKR